MNDRLKFPERKIISYTGKEGIELLHSTGTREPKGRTLSFHLRLRCKGITFMKGSHPASKSADYTEWQLCLRPFVRENPCPSFKREGDLGGDCEAPLLRGPRQGTRRYSGGHIPDEDRLLPVVDRGPFWPMNGRPVEPSRCGAWSSGVRGAAQADAIVVGWEKEVLT